KIVQEVTQLAQAFDGILHHHEHYDGSGYPDGLVGEDIPLAARIIQIADVFDALTSDRAYRKAFPCDKALDILREEAGRTIDPGLQVVFEKIIRERTESDPDGWNKLIETANCFTRISESAGAPIPNGQ
ncbi:MAG: HD domain-containing phosphohydrolase, partial [Phycisphaerae bacterium]